MNQQEYRALEKCVESIKQIAITNQHYEFAAMVRDIQRHIVTIDLTKLELLDTHKYYDRIVMLVDNYTTDKIDSKLKENLKYLHDVIMRPVIRQELISKILGEDDEHK